MSIRPALTSVEIHLEGQNNDDFMVSPFPIANVNSTGSSVVFIKKKKMLRMNAPKKRIMMLMKSSIIQLQKFSGFWEDLDALNRILGTKVDSIDDVKARSKDVVTKCVALAALRKNAPNERNSWIMIEQKAVDWLKKELKGIDIEAIIVIIQNLILVSVTFLFLMNKKVCKI